MFAAVRSFVHGLLAHPPGCPRCGSDDLRRSHRPSPLARLNVYRYRCRACEALFFMRASQMLAAQEREFSEGDAAEHSARSRRRHDTGPGQDPGPAEPTPARAAPPVDLEAVERDLAAARARALRQEARRR